MFGFTEEWLGQSPAESFTRWNVLGNHQTNVNPEEKIRNPTVAEIPQIILGVAGA